MRRLRLVDVREAEAALTEDALARSGDLLSIYHRPPPIELWVRSLGGALFDAARRRIAVKPMHNLLVMGAVRRGGEGNVAIIHKVQRSAWACLRTEASRKASQRTAGREPHAFDRPP